MLTSVFGDWQDHWCLGEGPRDSTCPPAAALIRYHPHDHSLTHLHSVARIYHFVVTRNALRLVITIHRFVLIQPQKGSPSIACTLMSFCNCGRLSICTHYVTDASKSLIQIQRINKVRGFLLLPLLNARYFNAVYRTERWHMGSKADRTTKAKK